MTTRLMNSRTGSAILAALIFGVLVPATSYAAGPRAGGGEPLSDKDLILPLTTEQRLALDRKMAAFEAMATLVSAASQPGEAASALPSSYTLSTRPRHQHRWFYCGPATVQVVSNYTWGYIVDAGGQSATGNKYKQSVISANWTKTDVTLQTYLADLITGMNSASDPPFAGFYMQWHNPAWSDFHMAIATDTHDWFMPLATSVNPRKTGSAYFLSSWQAAPAGDYGHYIPLRGYSGWSKSSAKAYYNDSSGGKDEVTGETILGGTGSFSDRSYTVFKTMMNRSGNLVW
jgi:hypothetical protein